ncbi:MAG TPA: hypothetical protein VI755_08850, partial [Anaerolineales bacterium]|nr:hypothetical protein [Anaerolineales bacterium]
RLFQQIVNQSGGVSIGQAKVSGSVIGEVHGDVIDARGAQGTIIRPTGPVEQVFGNKITLPISQVPAINQFTSLLVELRADLKAAGLEAKIQNLIEADVTTLEAEAKDPQPSLPVIETKLTGIQALLQKSGGVGPTVLSLIEIVEKSLVLARQLFK